MIDNLDHALAPQYSDVDACIVLPQPRSGCFRRSQEMNEEHVLKGVKDESQ